MIEGRLSWGTAGLGEFSELCVVGMVFQAPGQAYPALCELMAVGGACVCSEVANVWSLATS